MVQGMTDTLFAFLASFRIQDLFDILIIAFFLYLAMIWFKHATSRLVFIGMILLALVYVTARLFHLYLTTMVLQSFFTVIIIALVVIFQEDIRRFFERLATLRNMARTRGRVANELDANMEAILESSVELASRKTGALIVIEGEEPIERHLAGGFTLNGAISKPLIMSIFDPHSQGHDGAVVVRNGRIYKFGCHLPLSTNTEKLAGYGLRHTAALGLSERCDALCIVISEEKGTIAVAHNGNLSVLKNATELRSVLEIHCAGASGLKESLTEGAWFRKNTLEKGIALVLACTLWYAFGYQRESVQRDYIVPIEYRKISPEWEIEESRVTDATVTLMGSTQAFRLFDPSSLKISIDLSSLMEGRQVIVLTSDMVNVPSNLSLLKIRPDRIIITAHRLYPREVKVTPDTVGQPPEGYILKGITIEPEYVQILAPFTITGSKIAVVTEPIDLSGIETTQTFTLKVIPSTSRIRFKNNQQPFVRVTVEVVRDEKPQGRRPGVGKSAPRGFSVGEKVDVVAHPGLFLDLDPDEITGACAGDDIVIDLHGVNRFLEGGGCSLDGDPVSDLQRIAQLDTCHADLAEIVGDFADELLLPSHHDTSSYTMYRPGLLSSQVKNPSITRSSRTERGRDRIREDERYTFT